MFRDLARLFATPARIKLLKFFLLQPETRVSAKSVSVSIGISKRTAEEEMRALARADILSTRGQGKTLTYNLNDLAGFEDPLKTFLEQTTLPEDSQIVSAFRGVRGLTLLVTTGLLTNESRGTVDLLVVTRKPKDAKIAKAVKKIEGMIALPLRYAVLETGDYEDRLESYDRLLRDVFEFSHRVIFGRK